MKNTNLDGKCGSCLYYQNFFKINKDMTATRPIARGGCEKKIIYVKRTYSCKQYVRNTWYNRLRRKWKEWITNGNV